MRAAALAGVLIVTVVAPAPARAETGAATVIVLPFTSGDDELAIYGKPVADAVAKGLGGDGVTARAAGKGSKGDLVVELRVSKEKRKLRLEAIVRDPDLGENVASASAKPVPLSRLDDAAAELAKRLRDKVATAAPAAAARRAAAKAAKAEAAKADRPPNDGSAGGIPPAKADVAKAEKPSDTRPAILVYQPDGQVSGGVVPVSIAQGVLDAQVARLGYRSIASSNIGVVDAAFAADEARRASAMATIMLRVADIDFERRGGNFSLDAAVPGVLTARGRVRVKLVSADGGVLLDRTVKTDTLVGSRGDRHDALVRFVVRQALEILARDLGKALTAGKK